MTTLFGLLGDVQVQVDGRVLDLGHARQRCVLLVELNRTVSGAQLIDRVWGRKIPVRVRDTLYVYVSRPRTSRHCGASVPATIGYSKLLC
jgi:DNA-binding response OmpR family regulator